MLIGLAGLKGSGKDTFAEGLEDFTRMAFADPLKDSACALLGLTRVELDWLKNSDGALLTVNLDGTLLVSLTMREVLQRYGVESHREVFGDDFWIEQMEHKLDASGGNIVVTDARFANEQEMIRRRGGFVIEIQRPGTEVGDAHASEQVSHGLTDIIVVNDSTVEALHACASEVISQLQSQDGQGV